MAYEAFADTLTDTDTYIDHVGAAGVGYMAPHIIDNLADRFLGMDVPDEASGLATLGLAGAYGGDYAMPLMAGAGAYTFESAAERVGIRSTVTSLGGD